MEPQATESRDKFDLERVRMHTLLAIGRTYTLLDGLDILRTHANAPGASQMPCSLSRQVLNHDASEDRELCLHVVQDALVGEVEAIRYFFTRPS
jgi:hypothetical protein